MPGYSNRVVHIPFPELSDDPVGDPIWLSVRNPRLMSPQELQPREVPLNEQGEPTDQGEARTAMFELYAKMIVGWRAYDPRTIRVDPNTGQELDMELLPSPPTPELVGRLPMVILNKLSDVIKDAINPPSDSASTTTKTSSLSPSPSTKGTGPAELSPANSVILS